MSLVILPLSGGYDSTACLIKLLSEGYNVHAHHVHIKDNENPYRWLGEKNSVDNVIPILKTKYNTSLKYTESEILYSLDTLELGWWGVAIFNICFMLCIIYDDYCRKHYFSKKIEPMEKIDIAFSVQKSESIFWLYKFDKRMEGIIEGYVKNIPYDVPIPNLIYPILHMDKEEVINSIPKDILQYCFTCRRPDENLNRCYKCPACKRIEGLIP